jgi:Ca2+-dependent lipid-binding protein
MRDNLRTLKTSVKANLIKGNDLDLGSIPKTKSAPESTTKEKGSNSRPTSKDSAEDESPEDAKKSAKRTRTRSKTFTFSKSSPSKKSKGETTGGEPGTSKSLLPKSTSTVSLVGRSSMDTGKHTSPEEYVSYLRSEQKPEKVVVGKVHKLRQLLRNETVSWVETFIKLGGMAEIVGLLQRIMLVEWR